MLHDKVKIMSQEIQQLELEIEEAKKAVDLRDTLIRLEQNKDFDAIILVAYLREHAINLVHAKGDFALQKEDQQRQLVRDIDAIGALKTFLVSIKQQGNMAEQALHEAEDTRVELLKEDL